MKNLLYVICLCTLLLNSQHSFSSIIDEDIYLNERDMVDHDKKDLEHFHQIMKNIVTLYQDMVDTHGGTLTYQIDLGDMRVNAFAIYKGDMRVLKMTGGLIRYRYVDKEVFTAVACHEVGHFFGGEPLKPRSIVDNKPISAEGQADYFATAHCLKRYLDTYSDFKYNGTASSTALAKCSKQFSSGSDDHRNCLHISQIGEKTAQFLHSLSGNRRGRRRGPKPDIKKRDNTVKRYILYSHPDAQCRLDTFFEGALCDSYFPGGSFENCIDPENTTYKGHRPSCWLPPL